MHAAYVLSAYARNIVTIMQVKVVNRFTCAAAAASRYRMQMQRAGYVLYRALVMGNNSIWAQYSFYCWLTIFSQSALLVEFMCPHIEHDGQGHVL